MIERHARIGLVLGVVSLLTLGGCATTPKNTAPAPAPAPTFTLEGVNFANDSDQLNSTAESILQQAATTLKTMPDTPYEVAGHTDSNASDSYNLDLSQRRANRVRSRLIELGVSSSQLTANGYGESQPIADNTTAGGRATNRRVEIKPAN